MGDLSHWCTLCRYYFAGNSDHACIPNFDCCRYIVTTYGRRKPKPLFMCVFCLRFNQSCQRVPCSKRGDTLISDFSALFSCVQGPGCRMHLGRSPICLHNPGVNNLQVYTYFSHVFKDRSSARPEEYLTCLKCKIVPEPGSLFCAKSYVTANFRQHVKNHLLRERFNNKKDVYLSRALLNRDMTVSDKYRVIKMLLYFCSVLYEVIFNFFSRKKVL